MTWTVRRGWLGLPVGALLALAMGAGPGEAAQKIVIKFGYVPPAAFPYHDGGLKFKEEAERRTGGRVEVQLFPGGQLGGERDMAEGIRLGTLQMGVGAGAVAQFAPVYNLVELPFLIGGQAHMQRIAAGEAGRAMADLIEKQAGFRVLGWFSTGDSAIETAGKPVRKPEDLQGVKIRVMENPALVDSLKALGANPTPIPYPELYTSLKQGVVDGAHVDMMSVTTLKLHEVIKYITDPRQVAFLAEPRPAFISAKFYSGLPGDIQRALQEAMDVAAKYQRQVFFDKQARAIEELKKAGVTFTEIDREAFVAKLKPVWASYAKKLGPEAERILRLIQEAGR